MKPSKQKIYFSFWIHKKSLTFHYLLYIQYVVLIQYSKAFTSIFKALVHTKTINNDAHGYTHPWLTYLQINWIFTCFSLILSWYFQLLLNEPITKQLHNNYWSSYVSKHLHSGVYMFKHKGHETHNKITIPLQRWHLASRSIVTEFWKTNWIVILGLFHFIGQANG